LPDLAHDVQPAGFTSVHNTSQFFLLAETGQVQIADARKLPIPRDNTP